MNHEEIGKKPKRITKTKPFINKYKLEGIIFPSRKKDWIKLEKNNVAIVVNVLYDKKEKYVLLIFQSITQIVKSKLFF